MELRQAIANHFQVSNPQQEGWIPVLCPLHKDSNKSAGLNFRIKVFNCLGCNQSLSFVNLAKQFNIEYSTETEEVEDKWWLYHFDTPRKVSAKREIKELADFLSEKHLDYDTILRWGGKYVDDINDADKLYGYLKFVIGKGYAARKILPTALGERFRNNKGNKTLLGKENIKLLDSVILCEGITDFLSLWQMGYTNICCSMGSNLSKEQAYLLRRKTVFIIYDRDFAGFEGAAKAADLLREYKATPIVIELPDNGEDKNDINDMYRKDKDVLRDFLNKSLAKHASYDSDFVTALRKTPITMQTYSTGIPGLDSVFNGGFSNGVYALAGEEKIGKSTFISTVIRSFIAQKARVYLASYELSKHQMWARIASGYTEASWQDLEVEFKIPDDVWDNHLANISSNLKIEVGPTMDEIFAARDYFDIFIIDYIQRMPPLKEGMGEREAITYNNRKLSELMATYNKTIVMVSSMPRSAYGNSNSPSYKGSGDIEYTIQGGIRMAKMADSVVSFNIRQNTRGASGATIFAEVDWRHQILSEITNDQYFKEHLQ